MNKATDVMSKEFLPHQEGIKGEYLHALMLKLRPIAPGNILPYAGQLAHAALLRWFAEVDSSVADYLHEPNVRRPFTCSSLWLPNTYEVNAAQSTNQRLSISLNQVYWLRFTMMTDKLFRIFTKRFLQTSAPTIGETHGGLNLPKLRLGRIHFDVMEVIMTSSESGKQSQSDVNWSGYATYNSLVENARTLDLERSAAWTVGLEFRSPTAFSDGQKAWGKQMHLFPDPERVFESLARTWNTWAPSDFTLDVNALKTYAHNWVAISHYALQTHLFHFDYSVQEGFTGKCLYSMKGRESAHSTHGSTIEDISTPIGQLQQSVSIIPTTVGAGLKPVQALHLLANFAFYAGVGYKTAMGMGQTRPLKV